MKTIGLRSLYRVAPTLTEPVLVIHDRKTIGQFSPIPPDDKIPVVKLLEGTMTEQPIKKAIEPDKAKPDQGGQLRKGLGPLPGESRDPYREFRPVPKTKK